MPYSERFLADFEAKYCYDRYHERRPGSEWSDTRFMCCGHALVVTGDADNTFYVDLNSGILSAFRHQHFVVFMIAHFHKAALLMFSDKLAEAVNRLEVGNRNAQREFRAQTRGALEKFLRFTHRYWFQTISNQSEAHDLFAMCRKHLEIDPLYDHIRQEVEAMSQYLENEATRNQQESMSRLTVVTTLGLIGTVATGFLGMNLFDMAALDSATRFVIFVAVLVPTLLLTFATVARSQRLSEFLDSVANETHSWGDTWRAFLRVWWR